MEDTNWDLYGTSNYEKCSDCMAHCGYEPTTVTDMMYRPIHALKVALRGIKTDGPMAPEIDFSKQRPANYNIHEEHVEKMMAQDAAE